MENSIQMNNGIAGTNAKRQANFELLRVVSMLMVVALHYLSKGNVLPDFTEELPRANQCIAYAIESFCIVAVNAFVMLSGYMLIQGQFKSRRAIQLIGQVLFYAIGIPILLLITGVLKIGDLNLYTLGNDIFPIQTEHYWFATYYIFLYLCTPLLNRGIKAMHQRQHQIMIAILLLIFSIPKSLIPIPLATDGKGYDFVWFLCVYVIGAYIRLYGFQGTKLLEDRSKSVTTYFILSLSIFAWNMGIGTIYLFTGKLQNQIGEAIQYNHILCILAAVAFFAIFYYSDIKEGFLSRCICRISPYAFGVYLLHEQIDVRYLWPVWLQVKKFSETGLFLPHFVITILGIFILGIVLDYIRSLLFALIGKGIKGSKLDCLLQIIDKNMEI